MTRNFIIESDGRKMFGLLRDWFSCTMGLVQSEANTVLEQLSVNSFYEVAGDEPDVFFECNDSGYVDISDDVVVERRSNEFLYGDTYFEDSISHVAMNFYNHLEDGNCPEEEHESGEDNLSH